jgi:hypothetical protein
MFCDLRPQPTLTNLDRQGRVAISTSCAARVGNPGCDDDGDDGVLGRFLARVIEVAPLPARG